MRVNVDASGINREQIVVNATIEVEGRKVDVAVKISDAQAKLLGAAVMAREAGYSLEVAG
jgi:hypothetical protein